jgi:uncharacterized protein
MTIHQTIKESIKDAMRAKDQVKLDTLRGLVTLFTNEIITKKMPATTEYLDDDSTINLIKRSVKQRKEAIDQYEKGGRNDLAEKERAELSILEKYLPVSMSEEDILKVVVEKLGGKESITKEEAGKFTGMIMKELKGKADGALVKKVVDGMVK